MMAASAIRGNAKLGRADRVMRPYSPFEGLINECPRLCRGMVSAPSMGAVLEVKVLPRAGHSERSEA